MKNRNMRKVAALIAALVLLSGVLYLGNAITGYPVSYFVVKRAADAYLAKTYGGTDFVASKPERSLKQGGFWVDVTSPSSADTHFSIQFRNDGSLICDSYESSVKSGFNTAFRLSQEYNRLCTSVFSAKPFPWPASCSGNFTEAMSSGEHTIGQPGTRPEPMDLSALKLDAHPDLSTLSAKHGILNLSVESEDVSVETAAQALLAVRQIMEESGLPFRCAELWLSAPEAGAHPSGKEALHILNFGWDDIYEDGMETRVQAALDATTAYYRAD